MPDRFVYQAFSVGVSGHITAPFDELIPVQGSCALPEGGGFATSRVDRFHFRDILSFASCRAIVAGSDSPPSQNKGASHDATATAIVEGLDIMGVITADRIVARIASSHPLDRTQPSSITPISSYFENLRIAGYPVRVELAIDEFARFATAQSVRDAFRDNTAGFRDQFRQMSMTGKEAEIPERLAEFFAAPAARSDEKIPETNGIIVCPLVRRIEGLGPELTRCGNVIAVEGFGVIRLAELKITDSARRVTMLSVALGSTPRGTMAVCGAQGNGDGY